MKTERIYPLIGALTVFAAVCLPQALAATPQYSQRSAAVVPDMAPAALCQRYIVGGRQIRKLSPGAGGTLNGLPPAVGSPPATVDYTVTDGNKLDFDSNTGINIAIVKATSNDISVIYYAGAGQKQDWGLTAPLDGGGSLQTISEFALCYGLPQTTGTPATNIDFSLIIPRCGSAGTPVAPKACPDPGGAGYGDSKEIVLVNYIRLRDDADVPVTQDQPIDPRSCFCTGGHIDVQAIENLVQCDDSLPAFDATSSDPPLTKDKTPGETCTVKPAPGTKVEAVTQLESDPYFCRTINGRRTCWAY